MFAWCKRHYRLLGVIAVFALANAALFMIGADNLVETIGVNNTYIVIFIIAALGGMSSFTGAAYVNAIVAFTAGGANPWLIGIYGGVGVFLSDSFFYILAEYGRKVVPHDWKPLLNKVSKRMRILPHKTVLVLTYVYHILPLPSDLMMLALVLGGYSYRFIAPIIFLAALTHSIIIAHFGSLWY